MPYNLSPKNKSKIEYYYQILKVIQIGEVIKRSDLQKILGLVNYLQLKQYLGALAEVGFIEIDRNYQPQFQTIKFLRITENGERFIAQLEELDRMITAKSKSAILDLYTTTAWNLADKEDQDKLRHYLQKMNSNIKFGRKPKKYI